MRDARRDLSRGLLIGVSGVVVLYVAVNLACLRVLGLAGLDATTTPASDVMRIAVGARGAEWIAFAIQFPLSDFSARACSRLRACTTRWTVTGFSLKASGNCSENRGRR